MAYPSREGQKICEANRRLQRHPKPSHPNDLQRDALVGERPVWDTAKPNVTAATRELRRHPLSTMTGKGPPAPPQDTATAPERRAELVLVSPEGVLLGQLPPVPVAVPWWPEATSVVRAVRERHGVDVTLLRLLHAERNAPPGGRVTYLAEVAGPVRCEPCNLVLDEHPLRNAYARPGGPRRDLAWASHILAARGQARLGPAEQIKTWNLSSLWRIPLCEGHAWLKVVPKFFAHEGPLIAALEQYGGVPQLLGYERGRALMAEIPGTDGFHATLAERQQMIDLLVRLVNACRAGVPALLGLGLPDFRARPLSEGIARSIERHASELDAEEARTLSRLLAGLEARWARLSECGLPDGLVHGDFHSGNVRVAGERLTLLDWGDAGIGHPLLDQAAFLERVPVEQGTALRVRVVRVTTDRFGGRHGPGVRAIRYAVERKHIATRSRELAHYDVLAGLANRALMTERQKRAIAPAARSRHHVAVHRPDHSPPPALPR